MEHKKPVPLFTRSKRAACPVCGQTSYSLGGMHPQCAIKQADRKRLKGITTPCDAPSVAQTVIPVALQKSCPECKASLHVREKACACGHTFVGE